MYIVFKQTHMYYTSVDLVRLYSNSELVIISILYPILVGWTPHVSCSRFPNEMTGISHIPTMEIIAQTTKVLLRGWYFWRLCPAWNPGRPELSLGRHQTLSDLVDV